MREAHLSSAVTKLPHHEALYQVSVTSKLLYSIVIANNYCLCVSSLLCAQLWDIRDGACKQTFTGHESDINTISACYTTLHYK